MAALAFGVLVFLWTAGFPLGATPAQAAGDVGQVCSTTTPGTVDATLSWPKATGASQVWLDLSLVDNGFAPGTYVSVGPFTAQATTYTWRGIRSGSFHYYRVNALYGDGWRLVKNGSFAAGRCRWEAATAFFPQQECSSAVPGKVKVTFSWTPSLMPGTLQWLDLSLADNGFQPGTFLAAGPIPAGTSTYTWDGLEPRARHFWRVNTLTFGGWFASPVASFGTISCGAPPPNPAMLQLRDSLASQIEWSGINAAVAVTDLQTGETVAVNGDQPRLAGCAINYFVLLSVVKDLQAGLYPESEVGELIQKTIYFSNPITARTLLLRTGGSVPAGVNKVNSLMTSLGMRNSLFDHPPAYPDEFTLYGYSNILTANDMNLALAAFYHGSVVNYAWRDYLLEKMTNVKPGLQYLIPAGVGYGTVSHKNGYSWANGGWIDNDVGIVQFESGGRLYAYVITFFSQDVPHEYDDVPLGQALSRLTWQYFSNHY